MYVYTDILRCTLYIFCMYTDDQGSLVVLNKNPDDCKGCKDCSTSVDMSLLINLTGTYEICTTIIISYIRIIIQILMFMYVCICTGMVANHNEPLHLSSSYVCTIATYVCMHINSTYNPYITLINVSTML